jgi:hypothetical protein
VVQLALQLEEALVERHTYSWRLREGRLEEVQESIEETDPRVRP